MTTVDKKFPVPPNATRYQVTNSSQIKEVVYIPLTKTMLVNFKSNDSVYSYSPVESKNFMDMINSPSIGAYFYKHFKKSDNLKVKPL